MASTDDEVTKVVTGRIRSILIYEISEHELAQFEQGSSATLEVNFGVALVSLALAGIFTICTATSFKPAASEHILWSFATVGLAVGAFLILKWAITAPSISKLATSVRNRAISTEQDPNLSVKKEEPLVAKLPEDPMTEK